MWYFDYLVISILEAAIGPATTTQMLDDLKQETTQRHEGNEAHVANEAATLV